MTTETLEHDPDYLWIVFRKAIREGRIDDAAEAQRRLAEAGVVVRVTGLDVRQKHPAEVTR